MKYSNFSEVEQYVKKNAPPTVFKYRSWTDDNHKKVLTHNQLWFSHPFDLNDPHDVRPELTYNMSEIKSGAFYQKLLKTIPKEYSHLTIKEKVNIAHHQWLKIKSNPDVHFNKNRQDNLRRETYDKLGVFSTSIDCLNLQSWNVYGDNHQGYSIGFNTSELIRKLNCITKMVAYSDAPFPYSFLGKNEDIDILCYKKISWSYEQELRFITTGIGNFKNRLVTINPDIVTEIILGHQILPEIENVILAEIKKRYPTTLPVYKIEINNISGITKNQIR